MKRDHQSDQEQDDGNESNHSGGQKRFRNDEATLRVLIPSRIAGAIIGKGGQHINRLRHEYKATINIEDCQGPERTIHIATQGQTMPLTILQEMLESFEDNNGEIDLRVLIHQSLAGCVIGKGGSKIKEIRDKAGCRILKVFSNMCPQSSDRVVQCVGNVDQCMEAANDILELIKDVPIKGAVHNYDPVNFSDIGSDKYGGFGDNGGNGGRGGRGGGGIRGNGGGGNGSGGGNFRDRFDRRGNDDRGDDRGGFNNRRNDGRDNGGRNSNSNMGDRDFIDPWAPNQGPAGGNLSNFGVPSLTGNNAGGFAGNNFGGSSLPNQNQFGNNGLDNGLDYGDNNNPNLNAIGGNNGGGNLSQLGGGQLGGSNSYGQGLGQGNNSFGNNLGGGNNTSGPIYGMNNNGGANNSGPNDEGKETTQVTIPKDLAGAIIGKGGGRIRRIRMDSNAFITIDEPLPGSTDRIITISGTAKQIQLAQYLLQQSVRDHRRN